MMGAKDKKDQSLSTEMEVEDSLERDDEDSREEDKEGAEDTSTKESKDRPGAMSRRKWLVLVFSICLVGLVVGLGMRFAPQYMPYRQKKIMVDPLESIKDNIREEPVDPFFIPLPPGAAKEVIRVDLSVISDGLAYLRFSKNDIWARDRLFNYLMEKVKKDQNLNAQISTLEMEMGGILRETLEANNILIRIREVRAF